MYLSSFPSTLRITHNSKGQIILSGDSDSYPKNELRLDELFTPLEIFLKETIFGTFKLFMYKINVT